MSIRTRSGRSRSTISAPSCPLLAIPATFSPAWTRVRRNWITVTPSSSTITTDLPARGVSASRFSSWGLSEKGLLGEGDFDASPPSRRSILRREPIRKGNGASEIVLDQGKDEFEADMGDLRRGEVRRKPRSAVLHRDMHGLLLSPHSDDNRFIIQPFPSDQLIMFCRIGQ